MTASDNAAAAVEGLDGYVDVRCFVGGPGTGKTRALVDRVASLVRDGVDPNQILVLAASPTACDGFKGRLEAALGMGCGVETRTARSVELALLGSDAARSATGRVPRLLAMFETNVLIEDLKTSGLRPGRLREMLKFFQKGWTELADDDPTWLYSDEELGLHGLIKDCLAYTGAMMPTEVANLAVRFARDHAEAFEPFRRDHVLVDDYQMLCRASQVFSHMLARTSLWVAGDGFACSEALEAYPYERGLDELVEACGAGTVRLEGSSRPLEVLDAAGRLRDAAREHLALADAAEAGDGLPVVDAHPAASGGSDACEVFSTPEEEVAAVVRRVSDAIAGGMDPDGIFVCTPNRVWSAAVASELEKLGVACRMMFDPRVLNGDVRDLGRCANARAFTLVCLAADPKNDLAWRSWCAFGDWLANSPGFAALRRCPLALHEALALLDAADDVESQASLLCGEVAADERESLARILDAYRRGRALLAELSGLSGAELLDAMCRAASECTGPMVKASVFSLFGLDGEQGGSTDAHYAADLLDRALGRLEEPGFGNDGPAVRVGGLDAVHGTTPELLVVTGFVNGFIPSRSYFDEVETSPARRLRMFAAQARRLYGAVGECVGKLSFTAFSSIEAERAQRLDLKVDRYRMVGGMRRALVSPSVLVEVLEG